MRRLRFASARATRRRPLTLLLSAGLLLSLVGVSGLALHVLRVPPPDGKYDVGLASISIATLPVPGAPLQLDIPRPLPRVSLWYPAPARDSRWLIRLRTAWGLRISGRALAEAPMAQSPEKFPVLVYFPGWDGTQFANQYLIDELVSRGFVVAGVRYPAYAPGASERTYEKMVAMLRRPMDFSSPAAAMRAIARATERVRTRATDARSVLDRLAALNAHDPDGRLTGRLDLRRVGIFGYSLGGAVAVEACWLDPRFKAAMNMDGWLFADADVPGISQPYLLITGDFSRPSAASLDSKDPWTRLPAQYTAVDVARSEANFQRHGGYLLLIPGATHEEFSDESLGLRARLRGVSGKETLRVASLINQYTLAFFRKTLLGVDSGVLYRSSVAGAGVRLQRWPVPDKRTVSAAP